MIQNYRDIFLGLTPFELVLLTGFGVLCFLRLLYLFLFTGRALFRRKSKASNAATQPLSLLLTVRNEEENLKKNLPKILSIDSVDFEMVVVDDFSQDNSYLVLGLLKERYKRLTISMLNQETRYSMKLAQNIGIKAAKNNWVLTVPVSLQEVTPDWLVEVAGSAVGDREVIVGYSGLEPSGGFFNLLFRIENYMLYTKSCGYILNGVPFVYTDENVAFRKEKYFELGGYGKNVTEPYANLELLINTFIRKRTTTVLFSKTSVVRKEENIVGADYFELLKKSIRIEKHLPVSKRTALFIDETGRLLFLPVAALVIVLLPELWILFAGLLGFQFLAHLFIIKISQNRLNERKIFISSLVYEIGVPYFKLFYRWHFNRRSKKNRWRNKV